MNRSGNLICTVCKSYFTNKLSDLLQHIRLFHAHQSNIRILCGVGGCQRVYSNFGTYQNHISAFHRCERNPTNRVDCSDNSTTYDNHNELDVISCMDEGT